MPNDGTGANWDETHPSVNDAEGQGPLEITDLRKAVRIRMAKEHVTPSANNVGGELLPGAGKTYDQGSAPTTRPDGVTPLDGNDKGRLWTNGTVLKEWNGAAWVTVGGSGGGVSVLVAYIKDVKANNSDAGTFTGGSWQIRTLNTLTDPNAIVTSLTANLFVLPIGTYDISVRAPAFQVDQHQARLYNVTDNTYTAGTTELSNSAGGFQTNFSEVNALLTLAAPKTFRVEHICKTTKAFEGFGYGNNYDTGISTVYTTVVIRKIA